MKKWLKILLILFFIGIVSAGLFYHFVIDKPHPDYDKLPAKYSLAANELYNQFTTKRKESETKYNGEVVEISGKCSNIEQNDTVAVVVFSFKAGMFGDEGIRCTLLPKYNQEIKSYKKDSDIMIKGYCSGYNDVDVVLIKCSIQK
jgi:hypothetical protein